MAKDIVREQRRPVLLQLHHYERAGDYSVIRTLNESAINLTTLLDLTDYPLVQHILGIVRAQTFRYLE